MRRPRRCPTSTATLPGGTTAEDDGDAFSYLFRSYLVSRGDRRGRRSRYPRAWSPVGTSDRAR